MKTLIIKIGATGDVVRTTTLLNVLDGEIHWLTADINAVLLNTNPRISKCIKWSQRETLADSHYNRVINLEDSRETAEFIKQISFMDLQGAYLNDRDQITYTSDIKEWFDLSIISRFGKERADQLKLQNRRTYQDLVFSGLGYQFSGHRYFIPAPKETDLYGDIAIAPNSGPVWPMKNWAYYDELKEKLETAGYRVNVLPTRDTLLEHIGDINNHQCLISGDSLPMHIALGLGIKCISIFICTSPWEIYDYGIQKKIVSPLIEKFFYKRDFDEEAVHSISLSSVFDTVVEFISPK